MPWGTNRLALMLQRLAVVSKTPSRSGVFQADTDPLVEQFTESVSYDQRLAPYDIRGSIAHARMLAQMGLLTVSERDQIVAGLGEIGREIDAGGFRFETSLEDVHMNIEAR